MSDYTQVTDYSVKDALLTGNPSKKITGTELDAEFAAIAAAIASKQNQGGSTYTNITLAGTTSLTGTMSGSGTIDGGTF